MYLLFILAQAMWFGRDVKQAEQVMPGIGKVCFKGFTCFLMDDTPPGWGGILIVVHKSLLVK